MRRFWLKYNVNVSGRVDVWCALVYKKVSVAHEVDTIYGPALNCCAMLLLTSVTSLVSLKFM